MPEVRTCHSHRDVYSLRSLATFTLVIQFAFLVMQPLSHVHERRGSLTSQYSKSPETIIALPPSPISSEDKPSSNILKALQLLKDRRACILDKSWNTIKLRPGEYDELWQLLGNEDEELLGYVEDKIQYEKTHTVKLVTNHQSLDYDPGTLEFVVRMPLEVHEYLGRSIERAICKQLENIGSGNDSAATLAQKIRNCGSTSIFLEDGARRDPDGQFKYRGAHYPSVIIEVTDSTSKKRKGKNLHRLADQYITESSGSIGTVIGISLDYRGTKKATLSIWHPTYGTDQQGDYLAADEAVISQVCKMIP